MSMPSAYDLNFGQFPVAAASQGSLAGIGSPMGMMNAPIVDPSVMGFDGSGGGNGFLGTGMTTGQGINMALGGLQTLGNLWMAFQSNKLAKKQFNYTKKITDANLANQISAYNTTLEDRIRSRSFTEGREPGYADQYMADHRLAKP